MRGRERAGEGGTGRHQRGSGDGGDAWRFARRSSSRTAVNRAPRLSTRSPTAGERPSADVTRPRVYSGTVSLLRASPRDRTTQRRSARTMTPAVTMPIPTQSRGLGRSPRKTTAKTATSTTLSLSTGATREASPIFRAR